LCKTATINELREWKNLPLDRALLRELDGQLLEIYETLRPKPIHYEQRDMLVDVFNKMVTKIFGNYFFLLEKNACLILSKTWKKRFLVINFSPDLISYTSKW
jgi:hypothetical protein